MLSPRPWIEALERHVRAAREMPEVESVHQLRVAAGRLGVWLRLARRRALRDDLDWLRKSAARVRDLDVLLARHGEESWSAALAAERAVAARELVSALETPRVAGLLQALAYLPPLSVREAALRLPKLRARFRSAATQTLRAAAPEFEELHRVRKRVRRLRYALEWVGRESKAEKALQDALGTLHDAAVASAHARAAGAAGDRAREMREQECAADLARVRELWQAGRQAQKAGR
jgi:CHAD domain-containing protein